MITLALKEFSDRLRQGWVIACVVVWFAAIGLTSALGMIQVGRIGVQGYERTAASLLNLAQYLIPLLALLTSHDLVVREREERTLHLILAHGTSRLRFILGKFLGGALVTALPLAIGFVLAGVLIGWRANDHDLAPYLRLAGSGVILGLVFSGFGLLISTLCRNRLQALVVALLTWCATVFAFDLVAMGAIVSGRAVQAAEEIELICDATHVNNQADIHSAFDSVKTASPKPAASVTHIFWVYFNPIDTFRILNMPALRSNSSNLAAVFAWLAWLVLPAGAAVIRFRKADL